MRWLRVIKDYNLPAANDHQFGALVGQTPVGKQHALPQQLLQMTLDDLQKLELMIRRLPVKTAISHQPNGCDPHQHVQRQALLLQARRKGRGQQQQLHQRV